jgi:hypothetical protein
MNLKDLPTKSQKITMRLRPCGCGCKGSDSWHAATFTRTVRDVEILERPILKWGDPDTVACHAVAKGTIKTPWGEEEVHLWAIYANGLQKIHDWCRASI